MLELGSGFNGSPGDDTSYATADLRAMARSAEAAGRSLAAAYLYAAAFEKDAASASGPRPDAVDLLRRAMDLACECKERALAEHVFERLEPHCAADETRTRAERLQELTLDKLEDFGLSRDDLREMAGFFSGEGFGAAMLSHFVPAALAKEDADGDGDGDESGRRRYQPSLLLPPKTPFGKITEYRSQDAQKKQPAKKKEAASGAGRQAAPSKPADAKPKAEETVELGGYDELIGYDAAIEMMHERGVGLAGDERFKSFVEMLSRRHGIAALPSLQTMVFRAASREDATHFMAATVGEMGLPTVRMYMEEAPNGVPVLCIMASSEFRSRFQFMRNGFDFPVVLMMEDVDLWAPPLAGASSSDEVDMGQLNQIARGAREAVLSIRQAVQNPYVTVMASCESGPRIEGFLHELLDPYEVIDIDVPTREERAAIWKHVITLYPSLRYVNLDDLVRLSDSMSRCDIYMAAREAVEQAFGQSVRKRAYVPVTSDNIFDKLAAYQPLDSREYGEMEDSVVASFKRELEHIDDLLREEGL